MTPEAAFQLHACRAAAMEPGLSDQDDLGEVRGDFLGRPVAAMEPGLSDQDDLKDMLAKGEAFKPQWSLVFPTRMTSCSGPATRRSSSGRNGAWSFRPG